MKVRGLLNYPGRSCEQRIPVNFKNSNGTVGRKKVCHKKSAEVVVGRTHNTEGPNVYMMFTHHKQCLNSSKSRMVS